MKQKIRMLSVFLCCVMLLASCSNLNTIKFKDEEYIDNKNNITYLQAPLNYEAVKIKENGVARVKQKVGDDIILYPVEGIGTEQMLANDLYEVFYAEGMTLPKVWEMGVSEVYICQTKEITAQLASINQAADVSALIELYRNGTTCPKEKISMEQSTGHYYLKFVSSTHPHLYYCLEYLEFEEDVVIYEAIKDMSTFTPKYNGVLVTYEDYEYEENGQTCVEHLAVYHFGTGILYDRAAGVCYPAESIVAPYMS